MKEKTPLINGGQNLFELNRFRFAQGKKLVQNGINRVNVLTTNQNLVLVYEMRTEEQIHDIFSLSISILHKIEVCFASAGRSTSIFQSLKDMLEIHLIKT